MPPEEKRGEDAEVRAADVTSVVRARWSWLLPAEIVFAATSVAAASLWVSAPAWLTVIVLTMSLVVNYHAGRESVRPGLPHVGRIVRDTGIPVTVLAVGVATGMLGNMQLSKALVMVVAASGAAVVATMLRRVVQGQVRVVVVGDRMAIAGAADRWAGDRRAKIVGALLIEPERADGDDSSGGFGVQAISSVDEVAAWVRTWRADLVVVSPGPGVTSAQVRRLSWDLERSGAALAVQGVLDAVSPHRIDSTHFAGVTLMHVRTSRPSAYIRAVKATTDRVLGAALLVFFAPVILAMVALVRLESPGRGIFTQTRVGRDGKPFTIYKMRTMRADAEQAKASLTAADEGNGVLFKIRRDPRITPIGSLLRKTSLDELPQLINVVRGEMSLIGPRPALPDEVERYSDVERRRLVVRPGMTGLWQVSGRSNLSWERSVELDLKYADNWRLTDDVMIGVRTVDAVLRSKGAY